jgi:hypothetical protein
MQIALGVDLQIDQTMPRHLIQHVIEKRQAGLKHGLAGAVQIDLGVLRDFADLGFQRIQNKLGCWFNSGDSTLSSLFTQRSQEPAPHPEPKQQKFALLRKSAGWAPTKP